MFSDAVKNLRNNKEPEAIKVQQIFDLISQRDNPNKWTTLVSVLEEDCGKIYYICLCTLWLKDNFLS